MHTRQVSKIVPTGHENEAHRVQKGLKMKAKVSKRAPKQGPGAQGRANMGPMGSKPGKTSKK